MSRRPARLALGLALLAVSVAVGCGDRETRDVPTDTSVEPGARPPSRVDASTTSTAPDASPPTPFDAAPVVFDTIEPPERVVEIPTRPPPPRPPDPDPAPRPPPPPPDDGPSGSCDVRASEGFCFAYTGPGWTGQSARQHCAGAPNSTFGAGTCPLEGRIATCAFRRPSDLTRELVYTYYEPYDIGLAELACPGTFTRLR